MAAQVEFLTKKERDANATAILDALSPDRFTFSTMLFGFADIIQSQMFNNVRAQCKTEAEYNEMIARMTKGMYETSKALDSVSQNDAEDLIILSSIMIDTINRALIREESRGVAVSKSFKTMSDKTES
ncbi:hypothetical protein ACK8P5_26055 (plasmid) [Paenibacillus sp. EC2-1]|uniref:hypothetical protein n=1 Tax=Paenibacillus sp. EC2-1 TaxID=3388665 RepID=UPI003BEF1189